ncbi:ABC transporter, permease protein 1 (cluster 11, riboflavin/purine nucleoside) [[Mycoplasma] cavipharyngis]|uniref:ABC transporter permease subunit n=1 Tax=[Mycoplasma] cavipharyngis TaxID=92757 RepID=UPI003703E0AD
MNQLQNLNSKFNQAINQFWKKWANKYNVSTRRKAHNLFWAIIFGLIISGLFISFTGNNPFIVYIAFFTVSSRILSNFLLIVIVYILTGIAVGIGFQAGLFNIGISGQMMLSGALATLYIGTLASNNNSNILVNNQQLFVAFLIACISGFFIAGLVGILKAFLKVNEVVSTILLNWIVYEFTKFLFRQGSGFESESSVSQSKTHSLLPFYNELSFYIIVFFLCVGFAILAYLWMKKTKYGYAIKMVGLSPTAGQYAGVNERWLTIAIMSFSGLLAGISGFLYYVIFQKNFSYAGLSGPISIGFDSIAITMLAYNSPLGIIFSSFFYGVFNVGSSGLQSIQELNKNLDANTYSIIVGLIIYFVAMTAVFEKLNLLLLISKLFGNLFLLRQSKNGYWSKQEKAKLLLETKDLKENLKNVKSNHDKLVLILNQLEKWETFWHLQLYGVIPIYYRLCWWRYLAYYYEIKLNQQKLKANASLIKNLKKQQKIQWDQYQALTAVEDQIAFLDQIQDQKNEIHNQLSNLGYFDKQQIKSNYHIWKQEKRIIFKTYKQDVRLILSLYWQIKFFVSWMKLKKQPITKIIKLDQIEQLNYQKILTENQISEINKIKVLIS